MIGAEPVGHSDTPEGGGVEGHGGDFAVAVAQAHGVQALFTLSGAHVFPTYDAAVRADPPIRLLDVRHEPTAVFAAEATGKLTRVPGLAVLTAGPPAKVRLSTSPTPPGSSRATPRSRGPWRAT
jgi:acetolactate synthase I/II/III large subunit